MTDYDRKWVKWLLLGMVLGYVIGKVITVLLGIVITDEAIYEFVKLIPAGMSVLGLFFVLFRYNKEKEDQLGE
mgnify:FL=1|jgi:hypothetical protein